MKNNTFIYNKYLMPFTIKRHRNYKKNNIKKHKNYKFKKSDNT